MTSRRSAARNDIATPDATGDDVWRHVHPAAVVVIVMADHPIVVHRVAGVVKHRRCHNGGSVWRRHPLGLGRLGHGAITVGGFGHAVSAAEKRGEAQSREEARDDTSKAHEKSPG